jgi:hypothetical protein
MTTPPVRSLRGTALLSALLLASACGGPPAAEPPAPAETETPPEAAEPEQPIPSVPTQRTDTEPGQTPEVVLYGVDLDTVQAGRFDQGKMWTFEFPPVEYFSEAYGIDPDSAWFARARLGALRIPSCSASFVSPAGLVLTNHHCARTFITQVSEEGENLLDDGFYARDLADERPVEDFEADQLVELVDVTDEVAEALAGVPEAERGAAREEVLEEIRTRLEEERGGEEAGIVVEMVSLYNGGRTSAYVFRRYTNARLVMAPELAVGFFGGDPDNFTYPRYNLDFAFFRIYDEDGEPLRNEHWFPVDDEGLQEGDPIFIVGNPGSTSRLQTVAQLEFRRDVTDRALLEALRSRMEVLGSFIEDHPEIAEERDLRNTYFSLSNSEKAYEGQVGGLEDPVNLARRADTEADFQAALEADPELLAEYGDLIARMAQLQEDKRQAADAIRAFVAFGSPVLESATMRRAFWGFQLMSARRSGAPEEQLESVREAFEEVESQHPQLDVGLMAARFQDMLDYLGRDHEAVQAVLQGRTPEAAAEAVVEGSVLSDSAQAMAAAEAGQLGPQDPAIQAFMSLLPAFLEYNRAMSQAGQQESVIAAELGRARFEVYGTDVPPDATFSLRIADGVVAGYPYNGTVAPPFTTMYGMYDRHVSFRGDEDWDLPDRWVAPPAELDLSTYLNFVSTADITGGNSGSPVLDAELELVGVVFDGNIESLPGDYIYLPELNRSVTVDVRSILESLDVVYDMDRLVEELTEGELVTTEAEADARR